MYGTQYLSLALEMNVLDSGIFARAVSRFVCSTSFKIASRRVGLCFRFLRHRSCMMHTAGFLSQTLHSNEEVAKFSKLASK